MGHLVVLFCSGVSGVLLVVGRGLKLLVDSSFLVGCSRCLSDQSQALEVSGPSSGGVLGALVASGACATLVVCLQIGLSSGYVPRLGNLSSV